MAPKRVPRPPPASEFETLSPLDDILLDPRNPRLEESANGRELSQSALLKLMLDRFRIEDVAESILATGYTPFDPLIGYRKSGKVIVREGNRRITALKLLLDPKLAPADYRDEWTERSQRVSPDLQRTISKVQVLISEDPDAPDVDAYMGFRHVTGILEWPAREKAKFIAQLVESHSWTYEDIAKRLGSYPRHIEKLYVAYRVTQQAQSMGLDGASEITFGILMRALQAAGIRDFLRVEYPDNPKESENPVPADAERNFGDFVRWTFGTETDPPVIKDSREITKLGQVLQSDEAVRYLRSAHRPSLDRAWLKSGAQRETLVEMLYAAADRLEESSALTPQHAKDAKTEKDESVEQALDKCALFLAQILRDYPTVKKRHFGRG